MHNRALLWNSARFHTSLNLQLLFWMCQLACQSRAWTTGLEARANTPLRDGWGYPTVRTKAQDNASAAVLTRT
ncbi:hypothetical protein BJV77DRAFT_1016212 [Russula vinacea]|nr:hypothetical protein BJV77DRAFT_1016212 [Russula vinacea]